MFFMRYPYFKFIRHIVNRTIFLMAILLVVGQMSGCSKPQERDKQAKQAVPAPTDKVTNAEHQPSPAKPSSSQKVAPATSGKSWKGVVKLNKRRTASEKSAPEIGYGEKTEDEIMREKPRKPRIGTLAPITGELREYGAEAVNGAELASDEINANGGIRSKEFELMVYDTKGSVPETRRGVETFMHYDVLAIVGAATGEVSFSATKLVNDNQVIMVSAGSRRRLGDSGPYNFRNTLDDTQAISMLVDYIAKQRDWKNFALFSSVVNDYSIQLNAIFKAELVKHKMNITDELYVWSTAMANINPGERTVSGQVAKLKKNPPDAVVFSGGLEKAVELVREMAKQGVRIPIIGSEDLMAPEFTSLGEQAVGSLVYSGFDVNSSDPKAHAFVKAYTSRFGKAPTRLAALSYDAYYMLAEAIGKARSLRPSHVRQALMTIKDFHGVTGTTSVGPTGEAVKSPFIFEMGQTGGNFEFSCINRS